MNSLRKGLLVMLLVSVSDQQAFGWGFYTKNYQIFPWLLIMGLIYKLGCERNRSNHILKTLEKYNIRFEKNGSASRKVYIGERGREVIEYITTENRFIVKLYNMPASSELTATSFNDYDGPEFLFKRNKESKDHFCLNRTILRMLQCGYSKWKIASFDSTGNTIKSYYKLKDCFFVENILDPVTLD